MHFSVFLLSTVQFSDIILVEVMLLNRENIAALSQVVRDYMGERDMTVREFAKRAGMSSTHVQNIKTGNIQDIGTGTLIKVAQAMGLSFAALMSRIGLIDQPRDCFSADELARVAPKPYKEILEKHGDLVIRIAEKMVLSEISPKEFEKIVDAIAEIKRGGE